eukprot:EG_transcript_9494
MEALHAEVQRLFAHVAQEQRRIPDDAVMPTLVGVLDLSRKLPRRDGPELRQCLQALHQRLKDRLPRSGAVEVVQLYWVLAQQRAFRSFLLPYLRKRLLDDRLLAALGGRDLSKLISAVAKLDLKDEELFQQIGLQAAQPAVVRTLDAQGLVNVLWGLTKLRVRSDTLLARLLQRAADPDIVASFTCQSIASLAYTLATLKRPDEPLLHLLAQRVCEPAVARGLSPQHTANLAWAYATLRVRALPLMAALEPHAARHAVQYRPQELANTLFGFATLAVPCPELLRAFASHLQTPGMASLADVPGIFPLTVSTVVWAYGQLGYDDPHFARHLRALVLQCYDRASPAQAIRCATGLIRLGQRDPELLEVLAARFAVRPADLLLLAEGEGGPAAAAASPLARLATADEAAEVVADRRPLRPRRKAGKAAALRARGGATKAKRPSTRRPKRAG